MARPKAPAPAPVTSLMASAIRYPGKVARVYHDNQAWQKEAWAFYAETGELRYAANWVGNAMSRVVLRGARYSSKGLVNDKKAQAALDVLFHGPQGQSQMLKAFGVHLTVTGEVFLVGRKPSEEHGEDVSGGDVWEVVGTQEMLRAGNQWMIRYSDGSPVLQLEDDDIVIRIWNPNPAKRIEADSPVKSLLPVLRELKLLNQRVFAQSQSRLAGAGILALPAGITFPRDPSSEANTAEQFSELLGRVMMTPLSDPGNPAAVVPIVITIPDELVGKLQHLTFWSQLDEHTLELRGSDIHRFAFGMDMPPEIILGTGDVNHWGGFQIDEASIKSHVEPLADLVVSALSSAFLAPQVPGTVVAYETTNLRLRPNRSKEAIELYDRGQLSGAALRRETGFDEDDANSEPEYRQWLLRKVASGSATPEQVGEALRQLGIEMPEHETEPTREARPDPSLLDHPETGPPERMAASFGYDMLVYRALERAGNRMRTTTGVRPPGVGAAETYRYVKADGLDHLLEDAWTCLPTVLAGTGLDPKMVQASLDAYCRELLVSQAPHDRAMMMRYLSAGRTASLVPA